MSYFVKTQYYPRNIHIDAAPHLLNEAGQRVLAWVMEFDIIAYRPSIGNIYEVIADIIKPELQMQFPNQLTAQDVQKHLSHGGYIYGNPHDHKLAVNTVKTSIIVPTLVQPKPKVTKVWVEKNIYKHGNRYILEFCAEQTKASISAPTLEAVKQLDFARQHISIFRKGDIVAKIHDFCNPKPDCKLRRRYKFHSVAAFLLQVKAFDDVRRAEESQILTNIANMS